MLYSDSKGTNPQFITLLDNTAPLLLEDMKLLMCLPSSSDFESMVQGNLNKASQWTLFEWKIRRTGAHSFPDIIANKYFGIEVKMTKEDKWTSTGNSIVESLRETDVEKIHIMFGKFWWQKNVKHRLYQECLSNIAVTHSPRYMLDMNLQIEQSIFKKMEVDYDLFRVDPKQILLLKKYYQSQLKSWEELWWMDAENKEKVTSPIIHQYKNLDLEIKKDFLIKTMILFPEIFWKNPTKYERPCAFLMKEYNSVCTNMRDIFTAWWTEELVGDNWIINVPQILHKLYVNLTLIYSQIVQLEESVLIQYWGDYTGTKYENWKTKVIDAYWKWEYQNWLNSIL